MQLVGCAANLAGVQHHGLGAAGGAEGFVDAVVAGVHQMQRDRAAGIGGEAEDAVGLGGFGGSGTVGNPCTQSQYRGSRRAGVHAEAEGLEQRASSSAGRVARCVADAGDQVATDHRDRAAIGLCAIFVDGVSPAARVAAGGDGGQGNAGFAADGERGGKRGANDAVVVLCGEGQHIANLQRRAIVAVGAERQALQLRGYRVECEHRLRRAAAGACGIGGSGRDDDVAIVQLVGTAADIAGVQHHGLLAAIGDQGVLDAVLAAIGKGQNHRAARFGLQREYAIGTRGFGGAGPLFDTAGVVQHGRSRGVAVGAVEAGVFGRVYGRTESLVTRSIVHAADEVAAFQRNRTVVRRAGVADGVGPAALVAFGDQGRQCNPGFVTDAERRRGGGADDGFVVVGGDGQHIASDKRRAFALGGADDHAQKFRVGRVERESGQAGCAGQASGIGGHRPDGNRAIAQGRQAKAHIGIAQYQRLCAAGGKHGLAQCVLAVGKAHHHGAVGLGREQHHAAVLHRFNGAGTVGHALAQCEDGGVGWRGFATAATGTATTVGTIAGSGIHGLVACGVGNAVNVIALHHGNGSAVGRAAVAQHIAPATAGTAGDDRRHGNAGFTADAERGRCRGAEHHAVIAERVSEFVANRSGCAIAAAAAEYGALQLGSHGVELQTEQAGAAAVACCIAGKRKHGNGAVMQLAGCVANLAGVQHHGLGTAAGAEGFADAVVAGVHQMQRDRAARIGGEAEDAAGLGGFGSGGTVGNTCAQGQYRGSRRAGVHAKGGGQDQRAGSGVHRIACRITQAAGAAVQHHGHRAVIGMGTAFADGVAPAAGGAAGNQRREGNAALATDGQRGGNRGADHVFIKADGEVQHITCGQRRAIGFAGIQHKALHHRGLGVQVEAGRCRAAGQTGAVGGNGDHVDAAIVQLVGGVADVVGVQHYGLAVAGGDQGFAEAVLAAVAEGQYDSAVGIGLQREHASSVQGFAGGGAVFHDFN